MGKGSMEKGSYEFKITLNDGRSFSFEGTIEKIGEQIPKEEVEKCLIHLKDICEVSTTFQQVLINPDLLAVEIKAKLPKGQLNQKLREEAKEILQKLAKLFQKMNFYIQIIHIKRGYVEVHRVSDSNREEQGLKDYFKRLGFKEVEK